jgi:hypothetical protein
MNHTLFGAIALKVLLQPIGIQVSVHCFLVFIGFNEYASSSMIEAAVF